MVITHWDPPRECTVKHLGKIVRGTGTFAIEPATAAPPDVPRAAGVPGAAGGSGAGAAAGVGTGSVFTWSEDVVPPFGRLGVFVWPVVRPVFEVMMRVSLRRLVREVGA